jgi:hypothetical protein
MLLNSDANQLEIESVIYVNHSTLAEEDKPC